MRRKIKILLSAYACEPNKGSEPGVGWNWAIEIAKMGHDVWVITRENNKKNIIKEQKLLSSLPNLHFIYYDLPNWIKQLKKNILGVHLYYFLWQIGIIKIAKKYNKKFNFDLVHHITFVTIHQPSFLFLLKDTKFVYGPTAGGDIIPFKFINSFPIVSLIKEFLRFIHIKFLLVDPLRLLMFYSTDLVFANSLSTKNCLPNSIAKKTKLSLAIGSYQSQCFSNNFSIKHSILNVGHIIPIKGIDIILDAFSKLPDNLSNVTLTFIGSGKPPKKYVNSTIKLNIINKIQWTDWLPRNKLLSSLNNYDILLFGGFRDSGGMVVLEALSNGIPVISLNLGGPAQIVNESCGRLININGKSKKQIILEIKNKITEIYSNSDLHIKLSKGAIKRSQEFTWEKTVNKVYSEIESIF